MNKTARRITATASLSAVLITGGGVATAMAQPAQAAAPVATADESSGTAVNFSTTASLNIDPVAIANAISGAVNDKNDRGAIVRAALDTAYYNSGGKNVAVVNQEVEFEKNFPSDKTAVANFEKNGKTYSIFIFEGPGSLENKGDGGWINWGALGNLNVENDKKIVFY